MFHISRNGSSEGPFDTATVQKMVADGTLKADDSLWQEGWDGWREVSTQFAQTPSTRPSVIAPPPLPSQDTPAPSSVGVQPVFVMKGINDLLEVFDDKVTITPKGLIGAINKGFKGTKSIPFFSISAIQFKKSGVLSGYLQFSIPGGNESRRGILAATKDENTFMFAGPKANEEAIKIKDYIEQGIAKIRAPQHAAAAPASVADELMKLADLRSKGILSDEEFAAAKASLLKG